MRFGGKWVNADSEEALGYAHRSPLPRGRHDSDGWRGFLWLESQPRRRKHPSSPAFDKFSLTLPCDLLPSRLAFRKTGVDRPDRLTLAKVDSVGVFYPLIPIAAPRNMAPAIQCRRGLARDWEADGSQ